MEQNVIELQNVTPENVWDLTEEQVFRMFTQLQTRMPKIGQRQKLLKIIETAFDLRTISKARKDKQEELARYGYKFFLPDNASPVLTGVYKRKQHENS
ncbi:MAG: hypothetical protein LUF87_00670 [Alistipes sp.]|nr:hypothetical protein [Alistipes sp.]